MELGEAYNVLHEASYMGKLHVPGSIQPSTGFGCGLVIKGASASDDKLYDRCRSGSSPNRP